MESSFNLKANELFTRLNEHYKRIKADPKEKIRFDKSCS